MGLMAATSTPRFRFRLGWSKGMIMVTHLRGVVPHQWSISIRNRHLWLAMVNIWNSWRSLYQSNYKFLNNQRILISRFATYLNTFETKIDGEKKFSASGIHEIVSSTILEIWFYGTIFFNREIRWKQFN